MASAVFPSCGVNEQTQGQSHPLLPKLWLGDWGGGISAEGVINALAQNEGHTW